MFKTVDIRKHLNHRVVYERCHKVSDKEESGISNQIIYEDTFWGFGKEVILRGIPVQFYRRDHYDNFILQNQEIEINESGVQNIYLLGFAEWGFFFDKLTVRFRDAAATYDFSFYDWWWKPVNRAIKKERAINFDPKCRLLGYMKANDRKRKRRLYYYRIPINRAFVESLAFSDNQFIHIMGIVLETANEKESGGQHG